MIRRSLSLLLCAALMVSSLLGGCTRKVDPELVYGNESSGQSSSQSSSSQPPEPPASSSSEPEPEPSSEPAASSEPEPEPEPESESAPVYVPAMSADFAQLEGLSTENRGWGPGVQVDDRNRPYGSTSFQAEFEKYCAYFIAPDTQKVYLTFDEGYEAEGRYTVQILDTLLEKDCKAVFFITGDYARRNGDLVQRMIDEGHVVGSHSWTHPSMPGETIEDAAAELTRLHDYVKDNFGYDMYLFRFPMGEFSEQTLALVQDMGYQSVFWSFAYRDWEVDNQMPEDEAMAKIQKYAHPGALFLLHAVSSTNAAILGDLIDWLRDEGYEVSPYDLPYFERES